MFSTRLFSLGKKSFLWKKKRICHNKTVCMTSFFLFCFTSSTTMITINGCTCSYYVNLISYPKLGICHRLKVPSWTPCCLDSLWSFSLWQAPPYTHVQPLWRVGVHMDIVQQREVAAAGMVMLCTEAYVRSIAPIYIHSAMFSRGPKLKTHRVVHRACM